MWSPRTAKTAAHLFAMDAMKLSIRLWEYCSTPHAISKSRTVAGGLGRAAMRRRSMSQTCSIDSGQESTLEIPYAVLFQLQACSPPDELYAVGHYHPGKQRNNGSGVRDDMRSKYLVCIPSASQSAIPNDMQVRTSAYADSTPYHQPALLYCDLSRTNAGLFRVPLSLHTRTHRVSHLD
ncbi:hypothetical protein TNCV_135691 [Trichonephila clavipes]|nr:hypothetical protein TNCV_135691 [Trichonephila clavipes]